MSKESDPNPKAPKARPTTPDEQGEFERFESLTKRVLSVPKKEIDRKAKARKKKAR